MTTFCQVFMAKLTKKDIFISLVIGEAAGLLILVVLKNLSQGISQLNLIPGWIWPVFFPVFCLIWLWLANFLSRFLRVFNQLGKFVLVGGLNFLVDLGILNLFIFLTDISAGYWYSLFKGIAFAVAVINSYILNRWWTFQNPEQPAEAVDTSKQFTQFLIISLIGLAINNLVASGMVNLLGPQWGIDAKVWASIGAVIASFVGMFWNFMGYKFIVFKK